jgi:hypothetical protein
MQEETPDRARLQPRPKSFKWNAANVNSVNPELSIPISELNGVFSPVLARSANLSPYTPFNPGRFTVKSEEGRRQ